MPEDTEIRGNHADAMSSDSDSDEEPQVESLVAGRAKRATAGNRLNSLLEKEADDELELLFAEDEAEEDVEFEGEDGEDASDVELDSSSDDEDQGPTAGADDLEGEKEIEKQDKVERRKKRKALEIFKKPGKRVKVDPTIATVTPTTSAARPKKKSERFSWLPTPDEGPVRSSSRKQTVQNKEVVHLRMQETEARRRQQIKIMEAAAKKKEASKPKAMTQADRMAEAARTEKKNAKSLNRWEEAETKRAEEQKARLEALKTRQLQGPVISWWSGPSKWMNGKLVSVGAKKVIEEVEVKEPVKSKKAKAADSTLAILPPVTPTTVEQEMVVLQGPKTNETSPVPSVQPDQALQPSLSIRTSQVDHSHPPMVYEDAIVSSTDQIIPLQSQQPDQILIAQNKDPLPPPPPPPVIEFSARNLVILENFDGNTSRVPELQNHVLLKKKIKLQKVSAEQCAITHHTAHYRDPKTGLAYASSYAYKEIQKLRDGGSRWSDLLGCYVGPVSGAARGVPEGFLRKA